MCGKTIGRLWIVRNLKKLGAGRSEIVNVYTKLCRNILELAVPAWTEGITSDDF